MAELTRKGAIARVVAEGVDGETLVVSSLGSASYYLYEVADRDLNLYTFGAMGQASSLALGVALARPEAAVIVLDGDGGLLMNLSILAVIADQRPWRFLHVVLDDGAFESTGGQPTLASGTVSLAAVAAGCGIEHAAEARTEDELTEQIRRWRRDGGVSFVDAKVPVERGDVRPRYDPVFYRYRFHDALAALGS